MRNTKQKQIINSVIEQLFHFTSDDLISKVNEIDSTIGRATIFRYLNELIEQKKLQKVHLDKKVVYDNCMNEHNHFVCEKCGKIIDLVKTQTISNPYGLVINRSSVTYYGLCDDCQK